MATSVFEPVDRNCLFFNQFEYSATFHMRYAHLMRCLSAHDIVKAAEVRNQWFRNRSWDRNSGLDQITAAHITQAQDMHYHLANIGSDSKQVIHSHSVYVYSNNPAALRRLVKSGDGYVLGAQFYQARLTRPQGVVQLKESKYQYRTYFKERYQDTEPLRKFLKNRTDCFGYTREFGRRLLDYKFCVQRHNFVDHHSAADALMLNMVCADIVRETLPIQTK
jgi:hypothetical protein